MPTSPSKPEPRSARTCFYSFPTRDTCIPSFSSSQTHTKNSTCSTRLHFFFQTFIQKSPSHLACHRDEMVGGNFVAVHLMTPNPISAALQGQSREKKHSKLLQRPGGTEWAFLRRSCPKTMAIGESVCFDSATQRERFDLFTSHFGPFFGVLLLSVLIVLISNFCVRE